MARLLKLLVVLAVVLVAVGFYRGWFHLTSGGGADSSNVTLTVDKDKVAKDRKSAEDKVGALGQEAKDKAEALSDKR